MEKYQYGPVKTSEDDAEKASWIPFLRQTLVCSGVLTLYFCVGICYGAPTIFIHQLRKEANSTDAVSVDMASWLSSVFGYSSIPWIFILTAISHTYGRRVAFITVSFSTILMFICFSCSVTTTHLLISTIMQGMTHASCFTISIILLAEFTSPEYRGVFLTMKTASVYWGLWFANAIGTFFHWTYIPLFGLICSLFTLSAFIWPESPYWLASKGKIEDCKKAHRWLKGTSITAELELENILSGNTEMMKLGSIKDIKKKRFYKPMILTCLLILQFYASGKLVYSVYAIEILKKLTSSESVAYTSMLILDGVTVFSMYVGSFLARVLKRRVQFFPASCVGILFLIKLSLYLYLIKLDYIKENNVLTISILTIFSIAMSCGPAIMAPSIFAEVIPLKYKNLCTVIVSLWFQLLHSPMLKLFPYIYIAFGLHGTFFCYGICMLVTTCILYKHLPETKNKTLQEIEQYFM